MIDGVQVRIVRRENSEPLNIHLVWGSVWERNCKDLQRKNEGISGADCAGGKFGTAEYTPNVGLSIGEIVRICKGK